MNWLRQRNRPSLFLLIHLLHKKADRFVGDFVDLLSDSTDWDDRLSGDGGIIEANQKKVIWHTAVFPNQQVQKNICLGIIRNEDSLFTLTIGGCQIFQYIRHRTLKGFMGVLHLLEQQQIGRASGRERV